MSIKKADAIRAVLEEDPNMKPTAGVERVRELFDLEITRTDFSCYKTQFHARDRAARNGAEITEGFDENGTGESGEITVSELRAIKVAFKSLLSSEVVKQIGEDPGNLIAWVEVIEVLGTISREVHGINRLKEGLEALVELCD